MTSNKAKVALALDTCPLFLSPGVRILQSLIQRAYKHLGEMFSFKTGVILLVNYRCLVRGHFPWYLDLSSILAFEEIYAGILVISLFFAHLFLSHACFYRLLFGVWVSEGYFIIVKNEIWGQVLSRLIPLGSHLTRYEMLGNLSELDSVRRVNCQLSVYSYCTILLITVSASRFTLFALQHIWCLTP